MILFCKILSKEEVTSVTTRTVAGSNLGHGRHFSPGRHLSGERTPSPDRAWYRNLRVPNFKFCQIKTHVFTKIYSTLPHSSKPPNVQAKVAAG